MFRAFLYREAQYTYVAMIKKFILTIGLALLSGLSTSAVPALAHVLESDNGVSAILHIKPDDRPVAEKPITINLLFSNDVGGFSLDNYNVKLFVLQNKQVKYTGAVTPKFFGAATEGEAVVKFPSAGLYTVRVQGSPITKDVPTFTLNYDDIHVGEAIQPVSTKQNGAVTIILIAFGIITIAMIVASYVHKQRLKKVL